jgi:hypothetical protein
MLLRVTVESFYISGFTVNPFSNSGDTSELILSFTLWAAHELQTSWEFYILSICVIDCPGRYFISSYIIISSEPIICLVIYQKKVGIFADPYLYIMFAIRLDI